MNIDFTTGELETVLGYWKDVSQDTEYISQETGLELEKIYSILDTLQEEGKIKNYEPVMNERIRRFFEMVDPETYQSLKLGQFTSHNKYFFNKKKIDRIYDAMIFDIVVKTMEMDNNCVIFDCVVDHKSKEYPFLMVYDADEQVYYGSRDGKQVVQELREALGDNMERFDQTTMKILHENLPEDFWEVVSKHN
jgi:DNA-binding Lrp family transcriptional regulator